MGIVYKETTTNEDETPTKKSWFFNHIVFTVLGCCGNIFFTAHLAYFGAAISMIEKRFQMKSTQSGLFFTTNDVVGLCTVLFITHFGQKSNRPRIIASLYTLFGIGAILSAMPNFIYALPLSLQPDVMIEYNKTTDASNGYSDSIMCNAALNDENAKCDDEMKSQSGALTKEARWIFVGQALAGLSSGVGPLMITFVDDNQKKKNTPLFIGLVISSWTVGIVLGFFLANFCLRLPVTFPNIDPATTVLDPRDPRFLGAWWLGLIICGVCIIICCLPLFFFPRRLQRNQQRPGNHSDVDENNEAGFGVMKEFFQASIRILTNVTAMTLILAVCFGINIFVGLRAFSTKYLSTQFDIPLAEASMIIGIIIVPCAIFGNITGGFIIKKLKLHMRGIALMAISLALASLTVNPFFFIAGCRQTPKAGLTVPYSFGNETWVLPELDAVCNEDCGCPSTYRPVCGSDSITYSSACHAGCNSEAVAEYDDVNTTVFTDCSCIPHTDEHSVPHAIPGECPRDCSFVFHLIIGLFLSTCGSLATTPTTYLKIRCVEERDRSLVLGFVNVSTKLLAYIPGPIIWGALVDKACVLFQESCGKTGNCVVYDTDKFRNIYYSYVLILKGLEVLCLLSAFIAIMTKRKKDKKYEAMKYLTDAHRSKDNDKDECTYI